MPSFCDSAVPEYPAILSRSCDRPARRISLAGPAQGPYFFAMARLRALLLGLPIVALLLALGGAAARADQTDPRLDGLFKQLKQTNDADEARGLESQIWAIWGRSDNDDVNQLMEIGSLAMAGQKYDVALKAFDRIIELAPKFAEGWNKRATLYYLMDNYPASLADIARTLELEPRHFGALSGLGLVNVALEHDEAALAAFERALAVDPHLDSATKNAEALREKIKQRSI
jgi:tetratricopeptide (TPR) repeat protein